MALDTVVCYWECLPSGGIFGGDDRFFVIIMMMIITGY